MTPVCPCTNTSYATWRLQTLRRLCNGAESVVGLQLPFLRPRSRDTSFLQIRSFHESKPAARKYIRDLKRTAKFKHIQLELAANTRPDIDSDTPHIIPTSKSSQSRASSSQWNPYDDTSLQELQDLVGDLRSKAKQAAENTANEEEGVPFEHSLVYKRKKPNNVESPFERKRPWDRPKKLQVHEVEVDKRLENNIWAQILASPLRLDRGTQARLPRDLTLAWGIMQNPEDEGHYLLPIEVSDLEALRQELQQNNNKNTANQSQSHGDSARDIPPSKTQPSMRVPIVPDRLLLQCMSDELIVVRPLKGGREIRTKPGRLNSHIVPQRWRIRQDEFQAFYRTRENFNKTLNLEPDGDEPDVNEMANFDELRWQPDITQRVEKILKERVLLVLEAVASGNTSGRAIHDRRIVALPVPVHGRLHWNEKGSLVEDRSDRTGITHRLGQENNPTRAGEAPDYIHGAICIHVGPPESFRDVVEQWHQQKSTEQHNESPILGQLPSYNIIPPMLLINNQYRLPVFNLETLLGPEHIDRLHQLIKDHEILTLDFWQKRNEDATSAGSNMSSQADAHDKSSDTVVENVIPNSPLDAGAQVLSSIITPSINTEQFQPQLLNPAKSSPSSSPESKPATPASTAPTTPYLILIKPRSRHGPILIREIWQLWRFLGGRDGLFFNDDPIPQSSSTVTDTTQDSANSAE